MKRASMSVVVVIVLTSWLVTGCGGALKGSGKLKTETYNFTDFSDVEISSAFEVEITRSSSYSVTATVDDNLIKYVDVSKEGETLRIAFKRVTMEGPVTLKARITMPKLRGLDLSGATRGTVSGFSSTENVDLKVSGASKIIGDISAATVNFDVSGASTVQLKGSAGNMVAVATGASKIKLAGFVVKNANVTLDGASTGSVNLSGRLDADLSGASKLSYIGEPTMGSIDTSGSSTINKN